MADGAMVSVQRPSFVRVIASDTATQYASMAFAACAVTLVFAGFNPPTSLAGVLLYGGAAVGLVASSTVIVWRYLLISRIVQTGAEVRARVLSSKPFTGEGGMTGVRVELAYDFNSRSYTEERSFVLESFEVGDEVMMVVDPKNPKRLLLRSDYYWRPDRSSLGGERSPSVGLPVDEESLWPKGVLLQLEDIIESLAQKDVTALILTNGRLTIGRRTDFPERVGSGYSFPTESLRNEKSWSTIEIARVELSTSMMMESIAVWVRGADGMESRALKGTIMGLPSTVMDLVEAGISRGIIPPDGRQLTPEKLLSIGMQVVVAEISKQFKRAAPQAEIRVRGEQLSEDVRRRLIR